MDLYVYPDTQVLKNKFDERNALMLQKLERRLSMLGALELRLKTFEKFDFDTLKYIHKGMFGSIYTWAGEIRTVDIAKGNSFFCPAFNIEAYANDIFTNLQRNKYLRGLDFTDFCRQAADLLGDLNALHPFREGNGRTQRIYIEQLCQNNGRFEIDFTEATKEEMISASIQSANVSNELMEALIYKCLFETKE